jgi:hypothetical protein
MSAALDSLGQLSEQLDSLQSDYQTRKEQPGAQESGMVRAQLSRDLQVHFLPAVADIRSACGQAWQVLDPGEAAAAAQALAPARCDEAVSYFQQEQAANP